MESEATMATTEEALDQVSSPELELDEDSIVSYLARLQDMHISVWRCSHLKTRFNTNC